MRKVGCPKLKECGELEPVLVVEHVRKLVANGDMGFRAMSDKRLMICRQPSPQVKEGAKGLLRGRAEKLGIH
jgi:hypothetical protein